MLIAISSSILAAESTGVPGFKHIRTLGGIEEYHLESNGLRVLLLSNKAAPVVTFMVTYHVGSRNEVTGTTGATHLLEHLMFKGTERFDRTKGTGFDQVLERVGAATNATTWHDRTNYFATVPSNALELLVELEADRMRNLTLREEDRRPEMTVVRNEFERGENDPMSALDKELWASAFIAHPYHHDTIGWKSDIEHVPISKLREFYDTYYWPDNATVTLIGDFEAEQALHVIRKHYGSISKSPRPFPEIYTVEPPQSGQRRVKIQRAGELGIVALSHKIPRATDPDWPAVQVFSSILTDGKTSRCYRALTDKNLTIEVSAFCGFNRDPSLHTIYCKMSADAKHEKIESALVSEIERVQTEGVTEREVKTAVAGLLAEHAFNRDGTFASAEEINECIAAGDWTLFITLADHFKKVTPADVQRVSQKWFVEKGSTAGWFIPAAEISSTKDESPGTKEENFPIKKVRAPQPLENPPGPLGGTHFASRVQRSKIAGIDTLTCPTDAKSIVTIRGSLAAGESADSDRALAHLAAGMIERGSRKHDQFAIADLLERVGATLDFRVRDETLEFEARCLSRDIELVVSLLAEQLREPAFSAREFKKLKTQLASEARQSLEDTDEQAMTEFSRAIFPAGHPCRRATVPEMISAIERAKLSEVRAFHAAHYGSATFRIVAVGDVPADGFQQMIAAHFTDWRNAPPKVKQPESQLPAPAEKLLNLPDKTSVSMLIGQATGLRASAPDWLALHTATAALGNGFTSRLVGNVRDLEGLTYGIGAEMRDDTFHGGAWLVSATFSPALLEKGIASTKREIAAWHRHGITAEDLEFRKSFLIGAFAVGIETSEGLSKQLLRCMERGLGAEWLDDFPGKVSALSLDEVNRAIRKYLDPSKMILVKAGTLP